MGNQSLLPWYLHWEPHGSVRWLGYSLEEVSWTVLKFYHIFLPCLGGLCGLTGAPLDSQAEYWFSTWGSGYEEHIEKKKTLNWSCISPSVCQAGLWLLMVKLCVHVKSSTHHQPLQASNLGQSWNSQLCAQGSLSTTEPNQEMITVANI